MFREERGASGRRSMWGGDGGCPTLPVLSKKAVCTAVFLKGISGDLQVAA